jgi:polysaccharide export outer membrane protein
MNRKIVYLMTFFLAINLLCTSCCGYKLRPIKTNCCLDGRRPQVFTTRPPYEGVLDYNQPCVECDEESCEDTPPIPVREVSSEDLNPFPQELADYRLQVGDVLNISIFGDEEGGADTAIVANDGKIYYLVLEGVQARGKTIKELSVTLEEKLTNLYLHPQVNIQPQFLSGRMYRILGRVQGPGVFPIKYPLTLRDAVAQSGGLVTEVLRFEDADFGYHTTADLQNAFLIRNGEKLNIDFEAVLYSSNKAQNVFIRPGDYIYIPPVGIREVYVLGNVKSAYRYPWVHGLTLMGALASAEGWGPLGYPSSPDLTKVMILRGSLDCPRVICVDVKEILQGEAMDVYLCPGDIVYVRNKQMRFGRALVRLAINSFLYSFTTAAGSYLADVKWFPFHPNLDTNESTVNFDD